MWVVDKTIIHTINKINKQADKQLQNKLKNKSWSSYTIKLSFYSNMAPTDQLNKTPKTRTQ